MHLLLGFIVFCVPWTCLGQVTEETGQTTKSDELVQQNSSLSTVHNNVTRTTPGQDTPFVGSTRTFEPENSTGLIVQSSRKSAGDVEETDPTVDNSNERTTMETTSANEKDGNVNVSRPTLGTMSGISTPSNTRDAVTSSTLMASSTDAQSTEGKGELYATTTRINTSQSTSNDHTSSESQNESASTVRNTVSSYVVSNVSLYSMAQTRTVNLDQAPQATVWPSRESYTDNTSVSVAENQTQSVTEQAITTMSIPNFTHSRNISSSTLPALLSSSYNSSNASTITVSSFSQSTTMMEDTTSPPKNITFEDFIELTNENVSICFHEEETLLVNAVAGQVSISLNNYNSTLRESCSIQFIVPSGLVLDMYVSVNEHTCFRYYVYLRSQEPVNFQNTFYCSSKATHIMSFGDNIEFELTRYQLNASIDLFFNFTAVPPPTLQVVYITSTAGYVQTPDWDGIREYPRHLDSWARVDVPTNFSVMVSFLALDIERSTNCKYDHLTLYVEDNTANESLELIHCNDRPVLEPTVFHTKVLRLHFKSDGSLQYSGFRLRFSVHPQSELPEELDDGKWNCSVPFWPNFQIHFNCNKVEECSSGEDEEQCAHRSDKCDKGFLFISSSCYVLIADEKYVTWNEAANDCLLREAYLASMNSPKEWEEVTEVVKLLTKEGVYFGLQTTGPSFPELYRDGLQWADGSAAYYVQAQRSYYSSSADCSIFKKSTWGPSRLYMDNCDNNITDFYLCEKDARHSQTLETNSPDIVLNPLEWQGKDDAQTICPSGHATHTFLACDVQSACWADQTDLSPSACDDQFKPPPPSLQCTNGVDHVPYTLVCDHRPDCSDASDENFCVFTPCRLSGKFQCTNKQCVEYEQRCDQTLHCMDGSDERQCPLHYKGAVASPKPPAIINFDGRGFYKAKSFEVTANQNNSLTNICPDTHFLCPGNLTYCMPVFVRCNGVYDCPGREDEEGCDRYQCPGFYRCRASPICVHASHLCDGVYQCPQHDDELLCHAMCPQNCTCQGLAFYCHGHFPAKQYPELRFLHARESGLTPDTLTQNSMFIYLNLAKCQLKDFNHVQFPNLRILDLSDNKLASINTSQMNNMNNLKRLSLAGNPLKLHSEALHSLSVQFPLLQRLDLSNVFLSELNVSAQIGFSNLVFLNLTGCGIKRIAGEGFQSLKVLRYLDMTGCPITTFPPDIFEGLKGLQEMWADNYKFCCPATLPRDFHPMNCHSPSDEISSCDALLRSDFYRVVLSVFAALAIIGNVGSFVYRILVNRAANNLGFGVFVTHLCASDFLMGVYLAIIGIADRNYQGNYIWKDDAWKESVGCKMAGFLSLLSSEVSAFIICLITLDRFLVLRFPFSNIHFRKKSAHLACVIVWLIGILLAGIPLLPVTAHWHFYSQNGICIPLPITRNDFAGHDYSFGVMIIVNFVLFMLIAAGQVFIYWSIRSNSMASGDTNKISIDLTIARRLITIAVSDFLCWFPIGVLGLLASSGVPIPGEVNVAIAIIILPVNSAINPFLYTINMLLESRRKVHEMRIKKMVMSTLASKCTETAVNRQDYTKPEALSLIRSWLYQSLLSPQVLEKIILETNEKRKALKNDTN